MTLMIVMVKGGITSEGFGVQYGMVWHYGTLEYRYAFVLSSFLQIYNLLHIAQIYIYTLPYSTSNSHAHARPNLSQSSSNVHKVPPSSTHSHSHSQSLPLPLPIPIHHCHSLFSNAISVHPLHSPPQSPHPFPPSPTNHQGPCSPPRSSPPTSLILPIHPIPSPSRLDPEHYLQHGLSPMKDRRR